jgi:hypothetical protein
MAGYRAADFGSRMQLIQRIVTFVCGYIQKIKLIKQTPHSARTKKLHPLRDFNNFCGPTQNI